jgi:transcriptional regulator with XRE-family HTH domain
MMDKRPVVPNQALKNARESRRWTQEDVAEQLKGADQPLVSDWERGVHVPSFDNQKKLCQIFDLSAEELGFGPLKESPLPDHSAPQSPTSLEEHEGKKKGVSFRSKTVMLIGLTLILALILASVGVFVWPKYWPNNAKKGITATSTSTTQDLYTWATSGTPVLNDPLMKQDTNNWDELSTTDEACIFTAEAYHVNTLRQGVFTPCFAEATNFRNFVFQVQMTLLKGDGGGLLSRAGETDPYGCRFFLGRNAFDVRDGSKQLTEGRTPTLLNQPYLLTVVAQGGTLTFYRDRQWIATVTNNTACPNAGTIGLMAVDFTNQAEVVYRDAEVWTL